MNTANGLKTPLYDEHVTAGARIVDFGGWDMPLNYGSQKEEHHAVRRGAGVFDVSHMTIVDLSGGRCKDFLRFLLANDVAKLTDVGKALYTCMLNEAGGVVDDLIVYFLGENRYRLVVNAATRAKDLDWIGARAEAFDVCISEREDLAMLAVQGPEARQLASAVLPDALREPALALKYFHGVESDQWFVARTGYTGEDGFELCMPAAAAPAAWRSLLAAGVAPCGLAARDTLRLEAAMNLYGNDMDDATSPLEAGLGWTIAWEPADREFCGRAALEAMRENPAKQRFVGLLLEGKGVLRAGQRIVVEGIGDGQTTSGGFSPTIGRSIALARVPAGEYDQAMVEIRGKLLPVRIVPTPFVRHGQVRIQL